jgi:hypothetical protein
MGCEAIKNKGMISGILCRVFRFFISKDIDSLQKGQALKPNYLPRLRYLGKIPQLGHSEYGFRIENEDKSVRMLILTIADSYFLTKQLMFQEAPDLCYQKVLTDLNSGSSDIGEDLILITESDIETYRSSHPAAAARRKSFSKPAE